MNHHNSKENYIQCTYNTRTTLKLAKVTLENLPLRDVLISQQTFSNYRPSIRVEPYPDRVRVGQCKISTKIQTASLSRQLCTKSAFLLHVQLSIRILCDCFFTLQCLTHGSKQDPSRREWLRRVRMSRTHIQNGSKNNPEAFTLRLVITDRELSIHLPGSVGFDTDKAPIRIDTALKSCTGRVKRSRAHYPDHIRVYRKTNNLIN